jgi:hypothetical protein
VKGIFDPYSAKPKEISWPSFVMNQVTSLGTFILEGYLENLCLATSNPPGKKRWVWIALDTVSEEENEIVMWGRVEQLRT